MRKTKWFPVNEKPVRVGFYECVYSGESKRVLRWWDGKRWRLGHEEACCIFGYLGGPHDKWRGLTEDAK